MAYDKQIFIANQTLKAEELNKMNDQIEANEIAISSKQNTLVSGTNIKTINGQSILGEGDITISGNGEAIDLSAYATKAELNNKYTKPNTGIPKTDLSTDVQNALTKANSAGIGTVTAVKINGVTKNPSNGVVDLGEIGSDGNSLPLTGGTLTGRLIAPALSSNNMQFNDNDELNVTGNNYINFWPAGINTANRAYKTFYRFVYGNANLTGTDVKSQMYGLTIGPALRENLTDGSTTNITLNEFDMHIDVPGTNVPGTIGRSQLHIGNADRNNVVVYGRINHANKASQLYNKLSIAVNGVTTEFDGSSSKTISIDTVNDTANIENLQDLIPSGKGVITRLLDENQEITREKYLMYSNSGIIYTSTLPTSLIMNFGDSGLTVKSVKLCPISSWNVNVFNNQLTISVKTNSGETKLFGCADIILSVSTDGGSTVQLVKLPVQIVKTA